MKNYKIAVIGACGMVGQTMRKVLEERKVPVQEIFFFDAPVNAGKQIDFNGKPVTVEELTPDSFDRGIDIALFAVDAAISKIYAPIAAEKGCIAIDNSSFFRMDENTPLIVPEVNPEDIWSHKGIIANPNCTTIQAVVALNPLHKAFGIKRLIYSTYQSVSGAGLGGILDLERTLKGEAHQQFAHPIAGNCIPQIDVFLEDGYTAEEEKMIRETSKILKAPNMKITATAVRVPVEYGHSESLNITFEKPYDLEEVRNILKNAPGVVLVEDNANNVYPLARNAAGTDQVYVGRVRRDFSEENSLNIWVVADNIRKGAATNAVQIAERIMERGL